MIKAIAFEINIPIAPMKTKNRMKGNLEIP